MPATSRSTAALEARRDLGILEDLVRARFLIDEEALEPNELPTVVTELVDAKR